MEILRYLLSFLAEEYGGEKIKPFLEILKNNGYDLKKTVSSITPETVMPIIKDFVNGSSAVKSPDNGVGLSPIADVADKEIVYTLNKYLSADLP